MWKSDITCPERVRCRLSARRHSLLQGGKGAYRCLTCDHVLELFDGSFEVLIRLTIPPVKAPLTHPKRSQLLR